mmetsp:Transcript_21036/g.43895  ORF Transcript_21036/g.43895 Transcript_21036/m.43895 type:complete len:163 (+) Transcript_21036:32-520(+)
MAMRLQRSPFSNSFAVLLLCAVVLPRLAFIPSRVKVTEPAALFSVGLLLPSAANAQVKAPRPEGLPDFLTTPDKEPEYASLWKQWGEQSKQVGPADPSLSGLSQDDRSAILGVLAISIFAVPVVVMGVFGAALKVPWARPEKDPENPNEKKMEIDFSDLKDI